MTKLLVLPLYPAIVYLCAMVGYHYGRGAWRDFRSHGFDQAVSIRLGVVIGFVFASGGNAAIWGFERWSMYLGYHELARTFEDFAYSTSFIARLALIVACLLHLYAGAESKVAHIRLKNYVLLRDILWAIVIVLWSIVGMIWFAN